MGDRGVEAGARRKGRCERCAGRLPAARDVHLDGETVAEFEGDLACEVGHISRHNPNRIPESQIRQRHTQRQIQIQIQRRRIILVEVIIAATNVTQRIDFQHS